MLLIWGLLWFPMVPLAILNGTVRETVIARHLAELPAHQLSCVTGIALFFSYTWLVSRRWPLRTSSQALAAGGIWLALTVAFEFGFGHWVAGHPWQRLLHDYDLPAGRLWVLVLLAVLLLPWLVNRLRS